MRNFTTFKIENTQKNIEMFYEIENPNKIVEIEMENTILKSVDENLKHGYQQAIIERDKFFELFDFSPVATFLIDNKGTIIELNNSFENLLTKDYSLLINIQFEDVISKNFRETFKIFFNLLSNSYKKEKCEIEIVCNDRSTKYIKIEGILSSNIGCYLMSAVEIIENENQKGKPKINEKRLQSIVNILEKGNCSIQELVDYALKEAIALTNSKAGYIYNYNHKTETFTHCSLSENISDIWEYFKIKPSIKLKETGAWGNVVRNRNPIIINNYLINNVINEGYPQIGYHLKNSIDLPVIIDGQIVAVVGVSNKDEYYTQSDLKNLTHLVKSAWIIVQKKKIEELFKIQNEELKEMNASKDKFFSIIAHDLKSPFSGFLGITKIMSENLMELTLDELVEMSVNMQSSASNLYKLLENLLEWSRIQRGVSDFFPEFCNLDLLIKQNIEIARECAIHKNIEIVNDIKQEFIVIADIPKLNTVLRNLISNSIKFTPNGGKIEVGIYQQNSKFEFLDYDNSDICIYVKDNGIGMGSEIINKLFKIDQKVSRPGTNNEPSTGLGLMLCKEFIEKNEGKIWVESEVDKGSTFYFTLPKAKNLENEIIESNECIEFTDLENIELDRKRRILISNLDYLSYNIIRDTLEKMDFELYWDDNHETTLEIINENYDFDILLMDVKKFESIYVDTISTIHKIHPDLQIVLISDCEYSELNYNEIKKFGLELIFKPIVIDKLKVVIANSAELCKAI